MIGAAKATETKATWAATDRRSRKASAANTTTSTYSHDTTLPCTPSAHTDTATSSVATAGTRWSQEARSRSHGTTKHAKPEMNASSGSRLTASGGVGFCMSRYA